VTTAMFAPAAAAEPARARQLADIIRRDGIALLAQVLPHEVVRELGEDLLVMRREAQDLGPSVCDGRGPDRFYVSVMVERIRCWAYIAQHPLIAAVLSEVLGPDYEWVSAGLDSPGRRADDQPWHADFPDHGVIDSLAVNVSTGPVTPFGAPFQFVRGTHHSGTADWDGICPPESTQREWDAHHQEGLPAVGDVSVRFGGMGHRGSCFLGFPPQCDPADQSIDPALRELLDPNWRRDIAVFGANAAHADTTHRLAITPAALAKLPQPLVKHMRYRLVDGVGPLPAEHGIEAISMERPRPRTVTP
jgi:hypothetical protein